MKFRNEVLFMFLICFFNLYSDVCWSDRFYAKLIEGVPEKVELKYIDYSDYYFCEDGISQYARERSLSKVLRADKISGFNVLMLTDKDQFINNIDTCAPAGKYTYLILDFDTDDSWPVDKFSDCKKEYTVGTENNFFEIEVPEHDVECVRTGKRVDISESDFNDLKWDMYSDLDYSPDEVPELNYVDENEEDKKNDEDDVDGCTVLILN
jgi:hypothetical protein